MAILNTLDDSDSIKLSDLDFLTSRLRETAVNVLPKQRYGVMTTESIVAFLGSHERLVKVCKESSCLAELGRMVSADYVAQARMDRFGNDIAIKTELYEVKSGTLIGSFTGYSKDIYGLLALIDEKAPDLFKRMLGTPDNSSAPPPAVVFAAPQREKEPEVAQEEEPPEELPLTRMATENRKKLDAQPSLLSLDLPDWLQLGLRAGINLSILCGQNEDSYACGDFLPGSQLGLVLDIALNEWFYIQPSLMYIQKGADRYNWWEESHAQSEAGLHYLEFPLLLSLKFSALRLNAGPYFGILFHASVADPVTHDIDIGLSTGIGFDIGMFYLGAFWDYGLWSTFSSLSNRTIGLNVGVNL